MSIGEAIKPEFRSRPRLDPTYATGALAAIPQEKRNDVAKLLSMPGSYQFATSADGSQDSIRVPDIDPVKETAFQMAESKGFTRLSDAARINDNSPLPEDSRKKDPSKVAAALKEADFLKPLSQKELLESNNLEQRVEALNEMAQKYARMAVEAKVSNRPDAEIERFLDDAAYANTRLNVAKAALRSRKEKKSAKIER